MKPIDRIASTNNVFTRTLSSQAPPTSSSSTSTTFFRMSTSLCQRAVVIGLLLMHCTFPTAHTSPVVTSLRPSSMTSPTFVVMETAIIECSAEVDAGLADEIRLIWIRNNNQTIETRVDGRIQIQTKQETPTSKTTTLMLINVSTTDSGVYRCVASHNVSLVSSSEINITVTDEVGRCGFESTSGLCGWSVADGTTSSWLRSNCSNPLTHTDHTYGRSSCAGHYMKFEPLVTGGNNSTLTYRPASLRSPSMSTTLNATQCFKMWYVIQGDSVLTVQITANGSTSMLGTFNSDTTSSATDGYWRQATVRFPLPRGTTYQIDLTASFSSCATCNMTVLVDDISMTSVGCQDDAKDSTSDATLQFITRISSTILPSRSSTLRSSTLRSSTASRSIDDNVLMTSTIVINDSKTTSSPRQPTTAPMTSTVTSTSTVAVPLVIDGSTTVNVEQKTDKNLDSTLPTSVAADNSVVDSNEKTSNDEPHVDGRGTAGSGISSSSNTGLAIGIVLAVMSAGACTMAVLYRRRRRGRKSTYITFGNPSYSREHLPANDFSLDSPLTLSSNGYTVLA